MQFANLSSLVAVLAATITTMTAATDAANSAEPTAVVRPTDEIPFAPKPTAVAPGASRLAISMPSQTTELTDDTVVWPTQSFAIPFSVESSGTQPVEVQLFVARGPGRPWRLMDRKPSTLREFPFTATEDGLYWFATRTTDQSGHPHQNGPMIPGLKIYVDSTQPNVELVADADASGRVDVTVQLDDATPLRSIQLHYVTDRVRQWISLDVGKLTPGGTLTFAPEGPWQQLSLQAVVIDSAGHQRIVSKLLQRPRIAAIERGGQDLDRSTSSTTAQYRTNTNDGGPQASETHVAAAPINADESAEPEERLAANPSWSKFLFNGYRGASTEQAAAAPPSFGGQAATGPFNAPGTAGARVGANGIPLGVNSPPITDLRIRPR